VHLVSTRRDGSELVCNMAGSCQLVVVRLDAPASRLYDISRHR